MSFKKRERETKGQINRQKNGQTYSEKLYLMYRRKEECGLTLSTFNTHKNSKTDMFQIMDLYFYLFIFCQEASWGGSEL